MPNLLILLWQTFCSGLIAALPSLYVLCWMYMEGNESSRVVGLLGPDFGLRDYLLALLVGTAEDVDQTVVD